MNRSMDKEYIKEKVYAICTLRLAIICSNSKVGNDNVQVVGEATVFMKGQFPVK